MEQPKEALRYNTGKIRYNLIPANAKRELARVYTIGAHKYSTYLTDDGREVKGSEITLEQASMLKKIYDGANNWRLGTSWNAIMESTMRHIEAFRLGEDFDELGTLHLSNAAWNLMTLLEYYAIYPQGDDREKKITKMPKIALDIDEVIADWCGAYCGRYNLPIPTCWNFDRLLTERLNELSKDKDFWMGLNPKIEPNRLPFEPAAYITSRTIPTIWTEEWLDKNGFPIAPVFTVGHGMSKVQAFEESKAEVLIDDSYNTFSDMTNSGKCCFLFDAPHNQRYNVGTRRLKDLSELFWVKGL